MTRAHRVPAPPYERATRTMRLFLAVEFEPRVRRSLREATAPLRAIIPDAGWVAEDRLHLTLKFLDDQPETLVPPLTAALGEIARRHWPVPIRLRGVGAFPNLRRPRVVWVGIAPTPKLELLQHDVEEGCAALGVEVEGKPFRPHLTIGRLRGTEGRDAVRELARAARSIRLRADTLVSSIELMHSTLTPSGPRYVRLGDAPLRSE
ncbi:MAG: RNA 2',3'-cyclic phosphodiesterase [Gemmatimonadaceae bacterium]